MNNSKNPVDITPYSKFLDQIHNDLADMVIMATDTADKTVTMAKGMTVYTFHKMGGLGQSLPKSHLDNIRALYTKMIDWVMDADDTPHSHFRMEDEAFAVTANKKDGSVTVYLGYDNPSITITQKDFSNFENRVTDSITFTPSEVVIEHTQHDDAGPQEEETKSMTKYHLSKP